MNKRVIQTICMNIRGGSVSRAKYLRKKQILGLVGERVRFQPWLIPLYPELIRLHNNITVAAGVRLITHDASFAVLNCALKPKRFPERVGCIEVMDNVFIGAGTIVLPNVRIGENVIIGAGSVVTKDLASNGVYVGCPAKRIGSFEAFCQKMDELETGGYSYPTVRKNTHITQAEIHNAWAFFEAGHRES